MAIVELWHGHPYRSSEGLRPPRTPRRHARAPPRSPAAIIRPRDPSRDCAGRSPRGWNGSADPTDPWPISKRRMTTFTKRTRDASHAFRLAGITHWASSGSVSHRRRRGAIDSSRGRRRDDRACRLEQQIPLVARPARVSHTRRRGATAPHTRPPAPPSCLARRAPDARRGPPPSPRAVAADVGAPAAGQSSRRRRHAGQRPAARRARA